MKYSDTIDGKDNFFDRDFLWLLKKAAGIVVYFSSDLEIIYLNSKAENVFNVSRKNVLGQHISLLFSPFGLKLNIREDNQCDIVRVSDGKEADTLAAKKIFNLGWEVKAVGKSDAAGYVIYADETVDVDYLAQVKLATGQEKSREESIESYAEDTISYLENIISKMPGNVYWMDQNCVCLGCNDNAAKFCGFSSRRDAVGSTYKDMEKKANWIVGHTQSWQNDDLEVIKTGRPKLNVEEKPVLMPDGKEVYYLTNKIPLFDKDKNVIGMLRMSIDITDRKLTQQLWQKAHDRAEVAEKELIARADKEITGVTGDEDKTPVEYMKNIQNYLESIIAHLPGNVFWLDKDGVHLGCNDNAAQFLKLKSRKDIIGLTYKDVEKVASWIEGRTQSWRDDDLEVIKTGKPKLNVEEKPIVTPDGDKIHYLTSRVPLFDNKNNVIGIIGVSIDISNRKKVEEFQKDRDVTRKTAEFMRMLAGSIAHEIRTPLAIVGINIDLLKLKIQCLSVDEQTQVTIDNCFNNIQYAIDLASHIVRDILTMLKTISSDGLVEKQFGPLSIEEEIRRVIGIYPFLNQEKDLVKLKFDKTQDFIYYGDSMLTQHVLFNLFKNALYAIKEAEKGQITIKLEKGKKYNLLKFRDTAMGIPSKFLTGVFDYFKTGKVGGAGLGLAFCKVVMNAYGGDIECNSKEGKYTEFVLKFPLVSSAKLITD